MGLATALGISGCDQIKHLVEKPVVCGDADSVRALQDKFKANVSAATKMYLSADSDINRQILTKLLNQLKIDLDQIQDQPNASYRCSARVNLTLPKSLLERANETRAARGDDSVAKAAAAQDIQLAGIEPYQTIEYTPTAGKARFTLIPTITRPISVAIISPLTLMPRATILTTLTATSCLTTKPMQATKNTRAYSVLGVCLMSVIHKSNHTLKIMTIDCLISPLSP